MRRPAQHGWPLPQSTLCAALCWAYLPRGYVRVDVHVELLVAVEVHVCAQGSERVRVDVTVAGHLRCSSTPDGSPATASGQMYASLGDISARHVQNRVHPLAVRREQIAEIVPRSVERDAQDAVAHELGVHRVDRHACGDIRRDRPSIGQAHTDGIGWVRRLRMRTARAADVVGDLLGKQRAKGVEADGVERMGDHLKQWWKLSYTTGRRSNSRT